MSSGDNQAAIPESMGSPAAPAWGRCLRAPPGWVGAGEGGSALPGLGEEGRLRKGVWQCPELRSLWRSSSSSMSPLVSIPFPQDSNLWSRRLLSAPIRCRGMERGRVAAPSFAAIPARLEPRLTVPCRAPAPSTSLDPVMGSGHRALCLHRSLDGSWEQRNLPLEPGRTAQPFAKQKQLARLIKC